MRHLRHLKLLWILLVITSHSQLFTWDDCNTGNSLINDMLIVQYWNDRINDRLPVTYNHLLQGGYFNMPSARMGAEGEIGFGYSSVPPYRNYNIRCQLIDRLEISGNYRIFKGVDDPILTPLGFGDLSDKGANVKLSLLSPEDSDYRLPGFAIGMEDFLGTRNFKARYLVFTQVFLEHNLEVSLGYGEQRIHGFFGGVNWLPFHRSEYSYLKGICLTAEYDATPYKDPLVEKHPKGRKKKTALNVGFKYRLWNHFDASLSYVRGEELAFSASTFYNFGETKGLLPKIHDPLPYLAPINVEPLGDMRPEDVMAQDLVFAMNEQGFDLLDVWLNDMPFQDMECLDYELEWQKVLTLRILNQNYRTERDVRMRLNNLLAYLVPSNIDYVTVILECEGFPIQEYHYCMDYVRDYAAREIGPHELRVLTPLEEVEDPLGYYSKGDLIFKQHRDLWNLELYPKTDTLFGSSRGKFKYALGLNLGINGYVLSSLYYSIRLGYTVVSNLDHLRGIDRLNPSQLINVRSDVVLYYDQKGLTLDAAFLQKNWNLGCGWYGRVAAGYFEEEYGGAAGEVLYYPLHGSWAIGLEAAALKKRALGGGFAFTDKVRKLDGFEVTYRKFMGSQYFLDLYYEWHAAKLDFKFQAGKFLANDYGVRSEISRYFPSGLEISLWYTVTNGHDKLNGQTYYDKGVSFSMPMDIFYTHSSLSRWNYGMSAWLRDVGVSASTGQELYNMIREQRVP